MRKGLQILDFSFETECLTHFGGLFLIRRFCNKLCLRRRLERILKAPPHWTDYHPADLILLFLYVLIAGLPRVNKTQILHYNGLFVSLLGLRKFPDETALRRFLHRLSPKTIRQIARLHDQLRAQLFSLPEPRSSLVFHLDSVVLTLYGKQQGARVGYNPKKKGRPSYHPLLCFEAHGQEFWHGSLRPGDAAANTGARALVGRCMEKVPCQVARGSFLESWSVTWTKRAAAILSFARRPSSTCPWPTGLDLRKCPTVGLWQSFGLSRADGNWSTGSSWCGGRCQRIPKKPSS